jgi:hypothetical protein
MPDTAKPKAVIFFPNGTAAVFDQYDQQMGKYQRGGHLNTVRLLAADGFELKDLDVTGTAPPQKPRPDASLEKISATIPDVVVLSVRRAELLAALGCIKAASRSEGCPPFYLEEVVGFLDAVTDQLFPLCPKLQVLIDRL